MYTMNVVLPQDEHVHELCRYGGAELHSVAAFLGGCAAHEAIKLLTGIGDPLVGRLMVYDALEMQYRSLKVRKDPDCALCGANPTVTELIDYEAFCGAISDEAAVAAKGSTINVVELKFNHSRRLTGQFACFYLILTKGGSIAQR